MLYVSYATSVSTLLPLLRLKFFYLASDGYCSYLNFLMTDFGLLLMMRLDCFQKAKYQASFFFFFLYCGKAKLFYFGLNT